MAGLALVNLVDLRVVLVEQHGNPDLGHLDTHDLVGLGVPGRPVPRANGTERAESVLPPGRRLEAGGVGRSLGAGLPVGTAALGFENHVIAVEDLRVGARRQRLGSGPARELQVVLDVAGVADDVQELDLVGLGQRLELPEGLGGPATRILRFLPGEPCHAGGRRRGILGGGRGTTDRRERHRTENAAIPAPRIDLPFTASPCIHLSPRPAAIPKESTEETGRVSRKSIPAEEPSPNAEHLLSFDTGGRATEKPGVWDSLRHPGSRAALITSPRPRADMPPAADWPSPESGVSGETAGLVPYAKEW